MNKLNKLKTVIEHKENNKKISIIIALLYFLLHLFVVLNHECWRDEAQAWLIAKNLSYIDIFKELCVEGHPCLWFLLIAPFAKLGLSFYYFNYISLLMCTISVYILFRRSQLPIIAKIAVIFSSMFLFYNPVVCRSYSLIVLLCVILATEFKNRLLHPVRFAILISLLMQTHIVIYGLCFGLMIELLIQLINNKTQKKITLLSMMIPVLSTIILFIELLPRPNYPAYTNVSLSTILTNININNILKRIASIAYVSWGIKNVLLVFLIFIIFIIFGLSQIIVLKKNNCLKDNINKVFISFCGINYYFIISLFVYSSHSQLASILMMIIVFSIWIIYEDNNYLCLPSLLFIILASMLTFIPAQSLLKLDINSNYSTSKQTAKYIEKIVEENSIIFLDDYQGYDTPIVAYVSSNRNDICFYSLLLNKQYKYNSWIYQNEYTQLSCEEILNIDTSTFNSENIYYISTFEINVTENFSLIYKNCDSFTNENYYIYKISK